MATYTDILANNYKLQLVVNENSTNVSNNTSSVSWSLQLLKGDGSGKYADGPHTWSVNIGGISGSGSLASYDFRNYSSITLGSGSVTINHNADGTKVITNSASYDDNNTWGELGDGSTSGNLTLTTIPRASYITYAPNPPIPAGTNATIYTNRASTTFTHTITYTFGSASGTIGTGVADSVVWAVPLSLLNQIPNTVTGSGTFTTKTYSGSTLIGTTTRTFSISAPASVVPTFTTVTNSEATAGVAANVGAYVQSISTLNLAITGAAGAYGSTITKYAITMGAQSFTTATATSGPITLSGTVPIVGTVTDSRGRTTSKTINITVLAYTPPLINSISGQRALSTGTTDDNGTYVRVNINASVKSLMNSTERNAIVYKIYSRSHGTSTWTLKSTTTPGGISFNGYGLVSVYATNSSWDFRVEVIDDFATSAYEFTIATSTIFQHWDGSLGVGIGKYRENGMLDVKGSIYQNDGEAVFSLPADGTARLVTGSWDSYMKTGWYRGSGLTNAPTASAWYWVEVMAHDTGTWIVQTAHGYTGSDTTSMFVRKKLNGTWTAWRKFIPDINLPTLRQTGRLLCAGTNQATNGAFNWSPLFTQTFPQAFSAIPTVVAVCEVANDELMWAIVSNVSTTSFQFRLMRALSTIANPTYLNWQATVG